jgi:NDP-sugar pyrophosphorylase family protein
MKAMILAAGLGTRLRPLTDHRPKALVEVGGRSLLEITLSRLREFGVSEVIINVHHFADAVIDYLKSNHNFGMHLEVSREDELLDTGGGLKNASWFFLEDVSKSGVSKSEGPFILHNVDVISTIDLARMVRFHSRRAALATLAVQPRKTSRYLLFDQKDRLCGRRSGQEGKSEVVESPSSVSALGFSGIHVISPRIFSLMMEEGAFSIVDCYLRLAAQGENILAFRADDYYWRDLGKPENVTQAEKDFAAKVLL